MTPTTIDQAMEIALQHHQAGRLAEAEQIYRQVLSIQPDQSDALHLLGYLAGQIGRFDAAVDLMTRAIKIKPIFPEAYNNLGNTLWQSGRIDEAILIFQVALAQKPDYPEAYNNLGIALVDKGQFSHAILALNQAIKLRPDFAPSHSNLAFALTKSGRFNEAIAACHRALQLNPNHAEAYNNLGIALLERGQIDDAMDDYKKALAIKPNYPDAYGNMGVALQGKGQLDEAAAMFHRAISINPNYSLAHYNLGNVLKDQGKISEAIDSYRNALKLKPNDAAMHSGLILNLHLHPDFDAAQILSEVRQWSLHHELPLKSQIVAHSNDPSPNRKLKIGYVSADFKNHPVASFILPLLAHHDSQNFEAYCYSAVKLPDDITEKARRLSAHWQNIVPLSGPELAEKIRQDQIDILIDLSLHTADNRLLTFARKPAPVQVTWLGYPGTTGLAAIDYRLTDAYLDPPGEHDNFYTEKSIRLPHMSCCYEPMRQAPDVNPLPALSNGYLTFGSFNNFVKISPATLQLWRDLLIAIPDSRLILKSDPGSHLDNVRTFFESGGISPGRINYPGKVAGEDYFALFHKVDICLDPFPYSGHTTSLNSLWMGVPVITLAGKTAVGRGGVSILSNLGMPEWIASDPDQYIAIAKTHANDIPSLAKLRSELRHRLQSSPLMDARQFARDIESAYRQMWETWCATK
jgi:protein O-GlcNAc transferase